VEDDDLHIETMNTVELHALLDRVVTEPQDGKITPARANAITRAVGKRLAAMRAALEGGKR
jgi:hypothetical protein